MKHITLKLLVGCSLLLNIQQSFAQEMSVNGPEVQILNTTLLQMKEQMAIHGESIERDKIKMDYTKLKEQYDKLVAGKLTKIEEQKLMNTYLTSEQYDAWKVQQTTK